MRRLQLACSSLTEQRIGGGTVAADPRTVTVSDERPDPRAAGWEQ
jgi:hypothetical protein